MKYIIRLLVFACMLLPVTVWAQGIGKYGPVFPALTNSYFINLYYHEIDEVLYLTQETGGCDKGVAGPYLVGVSTVVCAESEEIDNTTNTAASLVKSFLENHWKKENIDPSERQSSVVRLASDIDFKGSLSTNLAGEYYCSGVDFGNSVGGLDFSGEIFDGTGKTISNVCGVSYAGAWKNPMGLFKKIPQGSTVKDLKLDNVNFIILNKADNTGAIVKTVPTTEENYSPVGALAGSIFGSQVNNISLGFINVSAPLVGGLAGYADNSTITDIKMMERTDVVSKIIVTNDIVLNKNVQNSKMGTYKTVLGGLVGASYYNGFKDISIYPETIQCDAAVDSSALGGLAGLFVYAPENGSGDVEIENITLASPAEGGSVHIEGGTAMGGLVGETVRENSDMPLLINNAVVKKLLMKESKVFSGNGVANGKMRDIYMGGLVGNSGLCFGGILKITNSKSLDFTISENVPSNGVYQYFIGGIAGYAGCDHINNANGDRNDRFLTLANSHASGNISLSGGHEKTTPANIKYHISASIGGLVGSAMFASENAVWEDTASVSILYEAKSTPAKKTTELDSIAVGGAFGAINIFKTSGVTLEMRKLVVEEYGDNDIISVDDNGINSYVGGVVGKFPRINLSGNSNILFNDISVSNSSGKIIAYGGSGNSGVSSDAFVGGVCGKCQAVQNLYRISVEGRIFRKTDADGVLAKKQFYLGGLVGSTQPVGPLSVGNTYSNGEISEFDDGGADGGSSAVMGYLIGRFEYPLGSNEFVSNYHIGQDFVSAIGDFGGVKDIEDFSTVPSYMLGIANVNVHDGKVENLNTIAEQKIFNCGVMTVAKMNSSTLVALLNDAWGEDRKADMIWTLGGAGVNKHPVFIDNPKKQVAVTFVANNVVVSKLWVEIGKAATAPANTEFPQKLDDDQLFAGWDKDFSNVTEDMTVTAEYGYEVWFNDLNGKPLQNPKATDGTPLPNPQYVKKDNSPVLPQEPEPVIDDDGNNLCFDGWDKDVSKVTEGLVVNAKSKPCGVASSSSVANSSSSAESSSSSVAKSSSSSADKPKSSSSATVAQSSSSAKSSSSSVAASSSSNVAKSSSSVARSSSSVKASSSSVAKSSSSSADKPKSSSSATVAQSSSSAKSSSSSVAASSSSNVAKSSSSVARSSSSVKASSSSVAKSSSSSADKPKSSSSATVAQSSSSAKSSSSSVAASSSSNVAKSSSSVVKSSSSVKASSSSNGKTYLREIAEPTVTQDRKTLRMTVNDKKTAMHENVDYHIVVKSDAGVYLDTVVAGKDVSRYENRTWVLDPSPVGEYEVTFTLTDGKDSVSYANTLNPPKDMQVNLVSNSWQTYSLYAFCTNKEDDCKYDLEERFSRKQEDWAVEECRHFTEELSNTPDDVFLREQVEEICRMAREAQSSATSSVFWWDEMNPVGDYWQYRKFNIDDQLDSTRGYWYGSVKNEPLTLSLQTPSMNDEIVWKLENKYSGWNLVANPYGWFVKLPQDNKVKFWKWNPATSGYAPADTIGPYEAVWAQTDKSRVFRIPLKASIVLEGEKKQPLLKGVSTESWNLRVELADKNGKRDSWNELAAGRVASSVSEPPAGMGDRVNLSIVDGKKRLAKSVKQNSNDLEWNLEASATTSRDGQLSFIGVESVKAKGLRVYATVGNETFEVVNDSPVQVKLSPSAKNVSVRVTKSAVATQVAKNLISGLRVNQAPNALNVGFDAASKLAGANVKVSVVGVDGRIVSTGRSVANEGSNVILMKKPKQGVYFVHLKVGSQTATNRILVH